MTAMNETEREKIDAALKAEARRALLLDDDLLKLIDTSAMRVEADGSVRGAAELLAQLKIDKPHLFSKHAREMTPQEASAKLNELRKGPAPAPLDLSRTAKQMTPREREAFIRECARRA
jgi:hypothetical protein